MAAVSGGHVEAVKLLLHHADTSNGLDRDLEDALLLAFQSTLPGQTDLVKLLFAHGANINQRDEYGNSVLRVACRQGSHQLVDCLVEAGADLTAVDCSGYSVLHAAANGQCTDIFASFIGNGVSIHLEDRLGLSALHLAMGHEVFAVFLLNSDCRWELASPYPWMIVAQPDWIGEQFRFYRKRLGITLLRRIANLQSKNRLDWSPLCLMAVAGNTTAMENLVELGACLDQEGSPHGSALMVACANRQLGSVKFLLRGHIS